MSDDTANHLNVIERLVSGTLPEFEFRYLGYAMIGFPMYWLSELTSISMASLFNWLHILLPFFIGLALYFVFSRLVNWITGLLMLIIPIFVSGASIYYLYYGIIFNSISVLILYPLLIYFVVKWICECRVYQLVLVVTLSVIAGTFHVSGMYLPVIFGMALLVYLVYAKVKHKKICKRKLIIGSSIVLLGLVCILVVPFSRQQIVDVWKGIHGAMVLQTEQSRKLNEIYSAILPFRYYLTTFVSVVIIILFGVGVWQIKNIVHLFNSKTQKYLCIMGCWCVTLLVVAYCGLSTIPLRQQTDFAIVFAMIATILAGVLVTYNKRYWLIVGILIIIGLIPQFIPSWFENNSAIKVTDKQALEYLNDYDYYDCSPTVSYAIYNEYTNAKYKSGADILVIRNTPMTQGSDENNPYWDGHGKTNTQGFELLKSFEDSKVKVEVFKRIGQ